MSFDSFDFKTVVDYNTLVDNGMPKPVSMNWPVIQQNPDSILLSESVGSTDGATLIRHVSLDSYIHFTRFISNYSIPIYHIDCEFHHDMGYDHEGRRAPYIDMIDVCIWTYAGNNIPVVHVYCIDVDRYSEKNSSFRFVKSYSPVDYSLKYGDNFDGKDTTLRMLDLWD